ncbi:MAG: hypothetical protein R3C26_07260 [Calditrichia bacterium]
MAYSMVIDDTLGYIVVNNSHKIEVISILDAERIATIRLPNGASPRNLVLDGNGNGYAGALYKNLIYQLNMDSYTVQDSIPVGAIGRNCPPRREIVCGKFRFWQRKYNFCDRSFDKNGYRNHHGGRWAAVDS